MAKKGNIWNSPSKYGTYEGPRGNPQQYSETFAAAFANSESVKRIGGLNSFAILDVTPTTSDEDIQTAYRRIARETHTDNGTNPNPEKFRQATEAYQSIRETRRKQKMADTSNIEQPTTSLIIPQLLTEVDEDELAQLLDDDNIGCQEKKDGKHITLHLINNVLTVRNKKGIGCECDSEFRSSILVDNILLDGEQINGIFYTWDILECGLGGTQIIGPDLRTLSYNERYRILKQLHFGPKIKIIDLIVGKAAKVAFYNSLKTQGKEGIVLKKLSAPFSTGKGTDQFKFKFYAECSVIVIPGRTGKASIGMELFNEDGNREFVGYCSCNKHPPIGSIVEIKYLYAYKGGCLYQPSFKEIRDDVDQNECKTSQLKYKNEEI